jgi:hypothetical protein
MSTFPEIDFSILYHRLLYCWLCHPCSSATSWRLHQNNQYKNGSIILNFNHSYGCRNSSKEMKWRAWYQLMRLTIQKTKQNDRRISEYNELSMWQQFWGAL